MRENKYGSDEVYGESCDRAKTPSVTEAPITVRISANTRAAICNPGGPDIEIDLPVAVVEQVFKQLKDRRVQEAARMTTPGTPVRSIAYGTKYHVLQPSTGRLIFGKDSWAAKTVSEGRAIFHFNIDTGYVGWDYLTSLEPR